MAWVNPKLDWISNPKSPKATDFNRIEGNIDFLKSDIETKKGAVVSALDGVGIDASMQDTYAQIASKITASNQGTKIITPGTANKNIAKGFHSGQGYVEGDADLTAANIMDGANIFGVLGTGKTPFIKSIQQFILVGTNPSTTNIDVQINAVDTDSTILIPKIAGSQVDSQKECTYLDFVDEETVMAKIYGVGVVISCTAIEFYPAVVKSLQKGAASISQGTNNVNISKIAASRSMAFVCAFYEQSSNLYGAHAYVDSGGELLKLYCHKGSFSSSTWQVIEFAY